MTFTFAYPQGISPVPTGSINFYDGTTILGSGILDPTGTATWATSTANPLTVGSHAITVDYSGDANYIAIAAGVINVSQVVGSTTPPSPLPPTTTSVTTSVTSASYGTSVLLTATVISAGSNTPTGIVNFYDGTIVVGGGSLFNGVAKASVNNLVAGNHTINASYFGDGASLPSTGTMSSSIAIAAGPPQLYLKVTPSITMPGSPTTIDVQLTTSLTNVPVGNVSCSSGSSSVGPVAVNSLGHAIAVLPSLPAGTNAVTCSFTSSVNSDFGTAVVNASVVPNSFASTGSLQIARGDATTTLLPSGKVLVAGGRAAGQYLDVPLQSAEIYDPASSTFSLTSPLLTARYSHTATLLSDGTVLIAGGTSGGTFLAAAEYYDPATASFHTTGSLQTPRINQTATLLKTGEVLITGGRDNNNSARSSAELYNPLTGLFSNTGNMQHARSSHTAVLMVDGRVLIAGGDDDTQTFGLSTAEIYDPNTGSFTSTGSLIQGREQTNATLLAGGKILIAGGMAGTNFAALSSAELYDPNVGTFSSTGALQTARRQPIVIGLNDGTVLVAGGTTNQLSSISSSEIYTPATGTFAAAGSLSTARYQVGAALVNDDQVLIAGGETNPQPTANAELFTYQLESGGIKPKFQILGVVYAPPGSGSTVTYNASQLASDTLSSENTFSSNTKVGLSLSNDVNVGSFLSGSSVSVSTGYTYSTDDTNSMTIERSQSNSKTVSGPLDSNIGVDHDYDIVFVWLNPVINVSIPSIANSVLWTGISYDQQDPNSVGNPDIIPVPVICLKNPYLSPGCTQLKPFLDRAWDKTGTGALTLADYTEILKADPFAQDPNYNPVTDVTQRFTVQNGTVYYPLPLPGQGPIISTGVLTVSNSTNISNSSSDAYSVESSFEAKYGIGFSADISATLSITTSNTLNWENKTSKSHMATAGTQSSYSISPPTTTTYVGPFSFYAWLDNIYQTFMFFSPSRSDVPVSTIGASSTSLSFGTTMVGQSSNGQVITITNNSTPNANGLTASLSFNTSLAAALSFSLSSYTLQNDSCTNAPPLAAGGTCSITVVFSPNTTDVPSTGLTPLPATLIIAGIELAPGSTNVMRTVQIPLTGVAQR